MSRSFDEQQAYLAEIRRKDFEAWRESDRQKKREKNGYPWAHPSYCQCGGMMDANMCFTFSRASQTSPR
jgi:hypothetical protein